MVTSFPIEADRAAETLSALFATEGQAREVAVLAYSQGEFQFAEYDNWDGGIYGFNFILHIPVWLFTSVGDQVDECRSSILKKMEILVTHLSAFYIKEVFLVPVASNDESWRQKAQAWVSGEGVNNQGRVRSDNIASRVCEGLLFRSQAEINFFHALKRTNVPFAPLPVFVRGGTDYRRIEPDFIILKDGIVLLVEIDGDTVHRETPAEAHDRTTMLAHEGAHVERVSASECASVPDAARCVERLLTLVSRIAQRR